MRIIALLAPLALVSACSKTPEAPPAKTAAIVDRPSSSTAEARREVAIEVDADGYRPDRITAKPGEPLALVFTRTTDSRCAEKLVVPSAGVRVGLPVGEPVRVEVDAPASGELGFACGMDMLKGALVVSED